jgi:DnaJ-class molecular chaperone
MENLFEAAQQITEQISSEERANLQNMNNVEDVFQTVTRHFMKMMQNGQLDETFKKFQDPTTVPAASSSTTTTTTTTIQKSKGDTDGDTTDNLYYTMNVKLEQLYKGRKKQVTLTRESYRKDTDTNQYETFKEKKQLVIQIPPGSKNGEQIILPGESDRKRGCNPGDVIITIQEEEDELFEREDDNLFIVMDISFSEAFRLNRTFKHIDGKYYKIVSQPGDVLFKNNSMRKIKNLGMPMKNTNARGNLYIRFNIIFPDKIKDTDLDLLCKIIPPVPITIDETKVEIEKSIEIERLKQQEISQLYDENDDFYSDSDVDSDCELDDASTCVVLDECDITTNTNEDTNTNDNDNDKEEKTTTISKNNNDEEKKDG